MTPIQLDTALNLSLDPSAYRVGSPTLIPNQCFDGHLQRATNEPSRAEQADARRDRDTREAGTENSEMPRAESENGGTADAASDANADNRVEQTTDPDSTSSVDDASHDDSDEKSDDDLVNQEANAVVVANEQPAARTDVKKQSDKPLDEVGQGTEKSSNANGKKIGLNGQAVDAELPGQSAAEPRLDAAIESKPVDDATAVTKAKRKAAAKTKSNEAESNEANPQGDATKDVHNSAETTVAVSDPASAGKGDRDGGRSRRSRGSRAVGDDQSASSEPRDGQRASNAQAANDALAISANEKLSAADAPQHAEQTVTASPSGPQITPAFQAGDALESKAPPPAGAGANVGALRSGSGSTTSKTTGGSNISEVDRVRFVQRVARAVQSAGDRGGVLRLRLSPPELGSLRLEVSIKDGAMTAKVEAESTTARSLLLDHLPELKQRLAEQQIRVERFDVDLMNQNSSDLPQQSESQSQAQRQHRSVAPSRRRAGQAQAISPAGAAPAARGNGNGQLNVII
jgi:flagellar hook-length control protein FliK